MIFNCNCNQAHCCRSVAHIPELPSTDGVCHHLDQSTNRCMIYDSRPLICRVDDFWEANMQDICTRDEWYKENEDACKKFIEFAQK